MKNENMKGIALILFGILLCLSSGELNNIVLVGFSNIPFSLFGVVAGIIGLVMIFGKHKNENDR